MHQIVTGADVVKGGDGTLVFEPARYLSNDRSQTVANSDPASLSFMAARCRPSLDRCPDGRA